MKTPLLGAAVIPLPVGAGSVGFIDVGGYFGGGFLTLEEILNLIGAGTAPTGFLRSSGGEVHVIDTSHPTLTGAATFDLTNGNVHPGILSGDVDITTLGWPVTGRGVLQWSIEGDGSSTPTFLGVTWIDSAPGVIGSGDFLHGLLWSDDGGTTIWGAVAAGDGSATGGQTPYYIAPGETFTVPLYKQALFSVPITVDGVLDVVGYLIEVPAVEGSGTFTPAADPSDIVDPTLATAEDVALKVNDLMANMRTAGMLV